MKRFGLFLISVTIAMLTNGQTFKVQVGTSVSKLDWKYETIIVDPIYKGTLIGYSILVGLDYLEHPYYKLSSNIGILRKGGKGEIPAIDQNGEPTAYSITEKPTLDYLSINTSIDLKYPISENFFPYICCGPRIDYLVGNSNHFDDLKKLNYLHNPAIGLLLGCGVSYNISNFDVGLRADYYLNFNKIADWSIQSTLIGGEINVNTFTVNVTIGHKLY